ncbi:MAG: copper-binding protein [Burkholderiaceae bacterium]|nr:copper-binding protein [Burkholderiaceae bacterium]
MKTRSSSLAALLLAGALGTAIAQTPPATPEHGKHHPSTALGAAPERTESTTPANGAELSEGEVLRWNPSNRKVTLRHGPIHNLDMPAMTMVFQLQDAALAPLLQVGAKVRFRAEQIQGAYVLTQVQAAP